MNHFSFQLNTLSVIFSTIQVHLSPRILVVGLIAVFAITNNALAFGDIRNEELIRGPKQLMRILKCHEEKSASLKSIDFPGTDADNAIVAIVRDNQLFNVKIIDLNASAKKLEAAIVIAIRRANEKSRNRYNQEFEKCK